MEGDIYKEEKNDESGAEMFPNFSLVGFQINFVIKSKMITSRLQSI